MSNIIATNNFLSDIEKRILVALLDVIIPADNARGLPSAAELNFLEYLEEFGADHTPKIKEELDELNKAALDKTSSIFFELEKDKQLELCALLRETKRRFARTCLLYTSPSPRDRQKSRMPSSA